MSVNWTSVGLKALFGGDDVRAGEIDGFRFRIPSERKPEDEGETSGGRQLLRGMDHVSFHRFDSFERREIERAYGVEEFGHVHGGGISGRGPRVQARLLSGFSISA
jgi:hypothetical protein